MAELKKNSHITESQKKVLVTLLENEELRTGKFTVKFTFKEAQSRWQYIAEQLNSIPGAKKEWSGWRRSWQDLKKNVKKKSSLRRFGNATGGGPPIKELTQDEMNVLSVLDKTALVGLELVKESCILMDHDYGNLNEDKILVQEGIEERENPASSMASSSRKKRVAVRRLSETVKASEQIVELLGNKNEEKEEYWEKKLILMERNVFSKERIACAVEKLADRNSI